MLIDLHIHTVRGSSDSNLSLEELIQEATRIGLDGVCLTEHGGPWGDPAEFQRIARERGVLVIRAMEVESNMGHVTVYGVNGYESGIMDVHSLRRYVSRVGGYMVSAHPFRNLYSSPALAKMLLYPNSNSRPRDPEEGAAHPVFQLVDAIEVGNGGNTERENDFAMEVADILGKPCVGGSDAHSVHGLGRCVTAFEDDIRNEADFLEALKSGRFYAAQGLHVGELQYFAAMGREGEA